MAGIAFPFGPGQVTLPAKSGSVEEQVADNIRSTLLMGDFDLPYAPGLGAGLWALIFENKSGLRTQLMEAKLKRLLADVEPRATILGVNITVNEGSDRNEIVVSVDYAVKDKYLNTTVTL